LPELLLLVFLCLPAEIFEVHLLCVLAL
jgi:hypothetical protein